MNDSYQKTVSTLAISEKRPQRPGGCVGIFFQLFDWNRRSAKKRLLSKKLLPPARVKRVTKKFGGDEKLPMAKLLLIADENCGGFPKKVESDSVRPSPNAKQNSGMRTPNLVARLMGLESMPSGHRDKPKKTSAPGFAYYQEKGPSKTSEFYSYDSEQNLEKGPGKLESRPQKLQKTGFFGRSPTTKFGAEPLQFKSVLSQSRKQHQKLVSPVKSPRILSGKNASLLMGAATKILEPGLQATNRAKCSLTYTLNNSVNDKCMIKATTDSTLKPLKEQASCSSCGNLLDVLDFRSNTIEQIRELMSSTSESSRSSSHEFGDSKLKFSVSSLGLERERENGRSRLLKNQAGTVSLAVQAKTNVQNRNQNIMDRKVQINKEQDRSIRPERDVAPYVLKHNKIRQNKMLLAKDTMDPKSVCNHQVARRVSSAEGVSVDKNYVVFNRNSTCHSRTRMRPKVVDNYKNSIERTVWDKKNDSSSRVNTLARKRRPANTNLQFEKTIPVNCTVARQRGNVIHGKGLGVNAQSMSQDNVKNGLEKQIEGDSGCSNNTVDIVSFMFNSTMRHDARSSAEMLDKKKGRAGTVSGSSNGNQVIVDAKSGNVSSQKGIQQKEDALGALLEQKLRELTCLEGDESETGVGMPGKSTAAILEELISALSVGRPIVKENGGNLKRGFSHSTPNRSDYRSMQSQVFGTKEKIQEDANGVSATDKFSSAADCDNPSPTSILEASFSNDSSFSGSLKSGSGHNLHSHFAESPHYETQPSDYDMELLDSAASMHIAKLGMEKVVGSINRISQLHCNGTAETDLTPSNFIYAREVISNAELLFENPDLYGDFDQMGGESFVNSLLLETVETLTQSLRSNENKCIFGFNKEDKNRNQLRRFLFDCLIECLDSNYNCYYECGFRTCTKLPSHFSRENLTGDVYKEIMKGRDLAGMVLDEIIGRDIMNSKGKWTDFATEAFDMGIEIEGSVLQVLVDELVVDLQESGAGSF